MISLIQSWSQQKSLKENVVPKSEIEFQPNFEIVFFTCLYITKYVFIRHSMG